MNGARYHWYDNPPDSWFAKDFSPVFRKRCFNCHRHKVYISDVWRGRRIVTITLHVWSDIKLMKQGIGIENMIRPFGPAHRINLTHPGWSRMLTAPLALKEDVWADAGMRRAILLHQRLSRTAPRPRAANRRNREPAVLQCILFGQPFLFLMPISRMALFSSSLLFLKVLLKN